MLTDYTQQDIEKLHTILDWMRFMASQFSAHQLSFSHGMSTALDEAVYLSLRTVNLPIDTPEVYWHGAVTSTERAALLAIMKQRIEQRRPAAYLTQEGWFCGLPFYIDERVLVPRSPMAELIETSFSELKSAEDITEVLDLCTGSGCIGIACAYALPHANITLSDVSQDAIDVAKINIERHDVSRNVHAVQSDVFKQLTGKTYDVIISNPPYVDAEDYTAAADEFKKEPELGLVSGTDGLDVTREILAHAHHHLNDGGILIVEVGNSMEHLMTEYPDAPFTWLEFERGGDGVFMLYKEQLSALVGAS